MVINLMTKKATNALEELIKAVKRVALQSGAHQSEYYFGLVTGIETGIIVLKQSTPGLLLVSYNNWNTGYFNGFYEKTL